MKREFTSLFLILLISLSNCAETILPYTTYSIDTASLPFWSNTIMYNESIMFVGKNDAAPLIFKATSIIAVTSYDGSITYKQGTDYTFSNNKIQLTSNTRIPFFTIDEYYPSKIVDGQSFQCLNPSHKAILFAETSLFSYHQILVTYYHEKPSSFTVQESFGPKFQGFLTKLKNRQKPTLLFFGDSITVGANASGFLGIEPKTPIWPKMVQEFLENKFSTSIKFINTAVGGTAIEWGYNTLQQNVIVYNPDLVVIGFGMNDGCNNEIFKIYMDQIIQILKASLPQVEILLVSTTLPNKETLFYQNQATYEVVLEQLAKTYEKVGLARMTSMHQYLMKTKRFYDMTGNNINHPSDFLEKVYCQTVLKALNQV